MYGLVAVGAGLSPQRSPCSQMCCVGRRMLRQPVIIFHDEEEKERHSPVSIYYLMAG